MKDSPNKDNPQQDVIFVIDELLQMFNEASEEIEGEEARINLMSSVGSTFHARVLNAAKHLGIIGT